ncbi:hypothetical protein [Butyricicoccus porcorum]|uniref:hypothetical protein n=1 Tax=Butyricicoccus porcorum TaxID=1945634 RepID=UPI0013FDD260|nr:hypothetical protein [Butyricicoccus porcorum]MCI6927542.1 hypothetical protein [Butyricicoccus porcorum]MDD6987656.1 hypothetical protein [Butyricicoccus porcorum]MDY4483321.1 hypothetical protein [Butyricicoccus porcorum]
MTLTPQQEQELHRCMLLGLIQALHRTQHLTEAQFRELMDIWKPHAKAPPG